VEAQIRALVLEILTEHFMLEATAVAACLDGSGGDIPIASRRAIVVIARVETHLGLGRLIDPKELRPEQITSIRSVVDLITRAVRERG
jgi:hypothetical protein